MNAGRPGYALVLSMLLTLALATLSLGTLAVAIREHTLAASTTRAANAAHRAEAAALRAVAKWSTTSMSDLHPGEARVMTGSGAVVERIDGTLYRVIGTGTASGPGGGTSTTAAVLVRTLPLVGVRAALPGALNATGIVDVENDGVVAGGGSGEVLTGLCDEDGSPGVVAPVLSGPGTVLGDPPALITLPPTLPDPDPFGPDLAPGLATVPYSRRVAFPRAVAEAGACRPGPTNWGSPDPSHPCHDLIPFVLAGDLLLGGGEGRGTLVVQGDLRMTGGARFDGLVVVLGHLSVEDGASIRGAVRAGSATISDGSISRDTCALRAVLSAPPMDGAFRDPARWRLPSFSGGWTHPEKSIESRTF